MKRLMLLLVSTGCLAQVPLEYDRCVIEHDSRNSFSCFLPRTNASLKCWAGPLASPLCETVYGTPANCQEAPVRPGDTREVYCAQPTPPAFLWNGADSLVIDDERLGGPREVVYTRRAPAAYAPAAEPTITAPSIPVATKRSENCDAHVTAAPGTFDRASQERLRQRCLDRAAGVATERKPVVCVHTGNVTVCP